MGGGGQITVQSLKNIREDIPFIRLAATSHVLSPSPSVFRAAAGASPSPASLPRNKEQIMLDLDLKNINSHSKPHHIYPRDPAPLLPLC